ncbi:aminomethyltransferase [bacterium BMS3Abin03]|nr:aminomethyltransferase [bacterium BMS3Abin03]
MEQNDTNLTDLVEYLITQGYSAANVDGYKIINTYSSKEKEIESLYSGTGLRNISHYGIIELKGKDVLDFLHRLGTNTTLELPKAHVTTTLFTTDKGRLISACRLINFEDYQLLICDRENKSKVMSWIRKYIITDDVMVNDANGKYNLMELMGPQSDSFVRIICGNVVNEIEPNTFKIINTDNLLFFLIKLTDERDFSKFWLLADFENSKRLVNYMNENKGPFNFNLIGEEAYKSFRIEQGIPVAPNELNDNYNPHEAGLIKYVNFEKGSYIGQEIIARFDTYDEAQKNLCGIEFAETPDYDESYLLFSSDGSEIGKVTSIVNSIKLNSPIGLAYIRKLHSKEGTKLTVKSTKGSTVEVTVRSLPFC